MEEWLWSSYTLKTEHFQGMIIAVYDCQSNLDWSIEPIYSQKYSMWEVIIDMSFWWLQFQLALLYFQTECHCYWIDIIHWTVQKTLWLKQPLNSLPFINTIDSIDSIDDAVFIDDSLKCNLLHLESE